SRSEPNGSLQEQELQSVGFSVKDVYFVEGQPVTLGWDPPLIPRASRTARFIERLESLGAVLLGSASLDEGALHATGMSSAYGHVLNPEYPDFFAGGSSAGAAAAVAADLSDFALGTDFGGSIRI